MKNILINTIIAILLTTSCEEVIEIPLNSVKGKISITANLSNADDSICVYLSELTDFYNPQLPPVIENAKIYLVTETGDTTVVPETYPGYYSAYVKNVKTKQTYTLIVNTNNTTYIGTSYMQPEFDVDSIVPFVSTSNAPRDPNEEFDKADSMALEYFFKDSIDFDNYYKAFLYHQDTLFHTTIANDMFFDGINKGHKIPSGSRGRLFAIGDTVVFELQSINYETYRYFRQRNDSENKEGQGTAYTPDYMFTNEALGYFSAHSSIKKEIIIK